MSNKARRSVERIVVEPTYNGDNRSPKKPKSSHDAESFFMHIDRSVGKVGSGGYVHRKNKRRDSQMVFQTSIEELASHVILESPASEEKWKFQHTTTGEVVKGGYVQRKNKRRDSQMALQTSIDALESHAILEPPASEEQWKFQHTTTPSRIREHWNTEYAFVMAGIGLSVGLGNLLAFPGRVYENGGAAYLISYALLSILVGLPMLLLEATVGQYSGKGPIQMWALNHAAAGIGFVCVLISAIDSLKYSRVTAWVLFYMFASMQTPLPWTQCEEKWLEKKCYHPLSDISFPLCKNTEFNMSNINMTFSGCKCSGNMDDDFDTNHVCFVRETTYENLTEIAAFGNCSNMLRCTNKTISPSQLYFYKHIKMKDDANTTYDIFHIGKPTWYMIYCSLLTWIIVVFSLMKGVSTVSRVLYFTVIFPSVMLICLFVNVVTLDGAVDGMREYVIPDWDKLLDYRVWLQSGLMMTFSLKLASGGLVMLSSYNRYHQNIYRDASIIVMFDFMTSFLAGLVVYANMGVLTRLTGQSTYDASSLNLTFIVLADAISRLEWPTFWAVNFFLMMFVMAIDTLFFMTEIVLTTIKDQFHHARSHALSLTMVYCTLVFLFGLPLMTPGGLYLSHVTTQYISDYTYIVISILLFVVLVWGYGSNRLLNDLTDMLGFEPWPRWYWLISWMFIVPLWIFFVGFNQLSKGMKFQYFDKSDMETTSIIAALFLFILGLSPVPVWFTYVVYKADGKTFWMKLRNAIQPTNKWLPQPTSRSILAGSDMHAVPGSTEWPSNFSFEYTLRP